MLQSIILATALVVPLHIVQGTHGEPRLGLDVTIGSDPIRVMVDTGSPGLRLLSRVLHPNSATRTGRSAAGGYASTLQLQGEEASAQLTIGAARGDRVPLELVDSYHFADNGPQGTPEMFGGAFPGIIGIGMQTTPRGTCCTSPLPALADGLGMRYVVRAAFSGPQLILNPDDATAQTFTMADIGPGGWPQGCVTIDGMLAYDLCGEVLFDTGAFGVTVLTNGADAPAGFASRGAVAHLRVGDWNHDFTAGRGIRINVRPGAFTGIIVGLDALQRIDLLFNFNNHQLGLRDH